jgi:hypothetical protein
VFSRVQGALPGKSKSQSVAKVQNLFLVFTVKMAFSQNNALAVLVNRSENVVT